ncbi:hypothetical protein I4U23_026890 [Adineta vaga]|nr:hypothetical protein I4U23_026890 [Adineta vaga]
MKPNQRHKDSRITNISLNNFTGSISIIESISDDEQFMLSSPHNNGTGHLFTSNHHFKLITKPVLAEKSRKRTNQIQSITNTRRTSYNDSPSLILPIHQIEKSQHESTDSGIDLSSSTNSSVQYPQQQHLSLHRPLSALNECDVNNSNLLSQNSSSSSDDQEQITNGIYFKKIRNHKTELPYPFTQQHRTLNDLTTRILPTTQTPLQKANPSLRKPTKLNIIVQPSTRLVNHDEAIPSLTRTTSSSSNQTIKPKSLTPFSHYRNPEQIRAHINRSVIDRQHPAPPRRRTQQKIIPLDIPSSKVDILLTKQQHQSTVIIHPKTNVRNNTLGKSTNVNSRQALPVLCQDKRNPKLKRRLNEIKPPPNQLRQISDNLSRSSTNDKLKQNNKRQKPSMIDLIQKSQGHKHVQRTILTPGKLNPLPKIQSSDIILTNLLRFTPDGEINRLSKLNPIERTKTQHEESNNHQGNLTYRLNIENNPQSFLFKQLIPIDNNSPSQTYRKDSKNLSSHELTVLKRIDHEYSIASSSKKCSSKMIISKGEEDDLSMNYDSDDGWSNDSIEIIYIDERYTTQKKKISNPSSSSSSSHFILQPIAHHQTPQQKILLH